MRPDQKRFKGLSPMVIRSLGVLAITLIAMATPPAGSANVPNCDGCPEDAAYVCEPECHAGNPCVWPEAVPSRCLRCYVAQCPSDAVECPVDKGGPDNGTRVECVLSAPDGVPWR